jgi:group I intron endonuclease
MDATNLPRDGQFIYLLVNSFNRKVYVGKTTNMHRRCKQYQYDIRERKIGHINDHLARAMEKYGIDNFSMVLLEQCRDADHLTERELYWIDRYRATERDFGYNLRRDSREGMIAHPETRERIRNTLRAQWARGDRAGHADKLKARWAKNPDRRAAQGKMFTGYLTKYEYIMFRPDEDYVVWFTYRQLAERGFASVISKMHSEKKDVVEFKGEFFQRVPIAEVPALVEITNRMMS